MSSALLVTGGSRGIGAAIVRRAAEAGWSVAFTYAADADAARAVEAEVTGAGGRALAVRADVANEDEMQHAFAETERAFGPLGGLVNNAGITGGVGRLVDLERSTLERVFAINVVGAVMCAREAVRRMSTARGGRGGAIVNITSRAIAYGAPDTYVHYAASKGALEVFSLGLAREVAAEGVRVNAVSPGMIDTEIHAASGDPDRPARMLPTIPMHRMGTADEVAEAVIWLLSPASSYCVGATIDVGGGR
ncbi:MAG TPA: SDR family oxidoreductase [Candidatus Sulfotelmatobacter sp.]|nr:SDR family oxidoreductase [Candidatus Sulfotelmatobacter sp.]